MGKEDYFGIVQHSKGKQILLCPYGPLRGSSSFEVREPQATSLHFHSITKYFLVP